MKYVACMSIDKPEYWSQWHSGPTNKLYRSKGYDTRQEAEVWICKQLNKFKAEDIDYAIGIANKEYYINYMIIMADEKDLEINKKKLFCNFDNFFYVMHEVDEITL